MLERYPVDFDALEKDITIEVASLRAIFGFGPEHPRYQFELLKLRELIEKMRPDLVCKSHKGTLMILTDHAAVDYNDEQSRVAARKQVKVLHRHARIDHSALDDGQRKRALALQVRDASIVQAVRQESNKHRRLERARADARIQG